jgi:hypothetical protein
LGDPEFKPKYCQKRKEIVVEKAQVCGWMNE